MITLVIGLPGSGKTTYLSKVDGYVVDDIVTLDELPETIDHLWISDVNFCAEKARKSAIKVLTEKYPDHEVDFVFFENDPDAAYRNIIYRNDTRIISKNYINWLSELYEIPEGIVPIEIWQS